jgi:hypothetical protein
MEKISSSDHVRNELLRRVKKQRNILLEISNRKANCLLQRVIGGKIKGGIEVSGR